jgi:hypothetical protein
MIAGPQVASNAIRRRPVRATATASSTMPSFGFSTGTCGHACRTASMQGPKAEQVKSMPCAPARTAYSPSARKRRVIAASSPSGLRARSPARLWSSTFMRRQSGHRRANDALIGATECASA